MGREMAIKDYTMKFYYACLLYAIIGFSWGSIMGGVEQFRTFVQAGAGGPSDLIVLGHTHINLLGWVEMAIFGTIYYVVPRLYQSPLYSYRLMKIHFWTHNIGPCWLYCQDMARIPTVSIQIHYRPCRTTHKD